MLKAEVEEDPKLTSAPWIPETIRGSCSRDTKLTATKEAYKKQEQPGVCWPPAPGPPALKRALTATGVVCLQS